MSRTRVAIADDDVLLREGLASLLERSSFEVVGQAGNGPELRSPRVALSSTRRWYRSWWAPAAITTRSPC